MRQLINFMHVSAAVAVGQILAILICWQIIRRVEPAISTQTAVRQIQQDHAEYLFLRQFDNHLKKLSK